MLIDGRDPDDRKKLDALLDSPLEPPSRSASAIRRGAAFAQVGKAVVVRMTTIGEGVIKIVSDTTGFGKGLSDTIAKIGPAATTGLAVVGAAAVGAGVALYKIGENFQTAYNTVGRLTGATGADMRGLEDSFKNVAKTSGRSFDDIAKALGQVSVRTGLTGGDLEKLTGEFLTFSKVTGIDVTDAVNKVTRVLGDWGISTDDAGLAMDKLYVASTKTGVGVDQLAEGVVKFGSPMRQLGFSFEETTALIGKFEQEGVNTELVMGSMRIALGKLAKAGETDLPNALDKSVQAIANTDDAGVAAAKAIELFGARAGPDMAAAIREGRFEVSDLANAMLDAEGAVKNTAKETIDVRREHEPVQKPVGRRFGTFGDDDIYQHQRGDGRCPRGAALLPRADPAGH